MAERLLEKVHLQKKLVRETSLQEKLPPCKEVWEKGLKKKLRRPKKKIN